MNGYTRNWENIVEPLQEFTGEKQYQPLSECYKSGFKNIEFEVFQDQEWRLVRGEPRGYGYKFVIWNPFRIYKSLIGLESTKPIRNIKWL